MDKIICPLTFIKKGMTSGFFSQECIGKKCAWWYGAHACCSIAAIANGVNHD